MRKNELKQEILEAGTARGHFIFISGNHADEKFDFDRISRPDRRRRGKLFRKTVKALSSLITSEIEGFDSLITIGDGANCLSTPVSREVSQLLDEDVRDFQTRKAGGNGFWTVGGNIHLRGKRLVIVDDVYSYGTNMNLLAPMIQQFGGVVVGAAVVLNRSDNPTPVLDVPSGAVEVKSLIHHEIPSWPQEECLDCPEQR